MEIFILIKVKKEGEKRERTKGHIEALMLELPKFLA